jgi:hypothetical protein
MGVFSPFFNTTPEFYELPGCEVSTRKKHFVAMIGKRFNLNAIHASFTEGATE